MRPLVCSAESGKASKAENVVARGSFITSVESKTRVVNQKSSGKLKTRKFNLKMAGSVVPHTKELPLLPMEVWHHIWSFIDFENLQKTCVTVSKTWFNEIRNSPTLSNEMKITKIIFKNGRNEKLSDEDLNDILSKWPKLKLLDLTEYKVEKIRSLVLTKKINLKAHTLFERIIAKPNPSKFVHNWHNLSPDLTEISDFGEVQAIWIYGNPNYVGNFGEVQKIWIDPKNILAPIKLENIYCFNWFGFCETKDAKMKEMGTMMKNMETLIVHNNIFGVEELSWILRLKNLKRLQFSFADSFDVGHFRNLKFLPTLKILHLTNINLFGDIAKFLTEFPVTQTLILEDFEFESNKLYCNISSLLAVLNALGTMKNLQILDDIDIHLNCDFDEPFQIDNDLDEQETKGIFEKAMEIADQKLLKETVFIKDTKHGFRIVKIKDNVSRFIEEPKDDLGREDGEEEVDDFENNDDFDTRYIY